MKLKQYYYFHAKFLEEIQYLSNFRAELNRHTYLCSHEVGVSIDPGQYGAECGNDGRVQITVVLGVLPA